MANRPIFIPQDHSSTPGVVIKDVYFKWFPGMSKSQKQKSICSLHQSANELGLTDILEISSKSELSIGVDLSAFNLMITTKKLNKKFSIETAFQSSKVFKHGGPYIDLLEGSSQEAKKDERLKTSGDLIAFEFFKQPFETKPRTFFYDWLYINALHQNKILSSQLQAFSSFTDIEFNPKKSLNCQAYSAALYLSLIKNNCLLDAISSPENFKKILTSEYTNKDSNIAIQSSLF